MTSDLDAVDRLLLDELAASGRSPRRLAVIGDQVGALAEAATATGLPLRAHTDHLAGERRVRHRGVPTTEDLATALRGADLVLVRLPPALDALDEIARTAARVGSPDMALLAGGRIRHMNRSMNGVLARSFTEVRASLGRQKSRVLWATGPRSVDQVWPRRRRHVGLGITVHAHGGVFAGTGIDAGTALLVEQLAALDTIEGPVIDLGCGSGILATLLARRGADVQAIDVSAAAIASTRLTAGDAVEVRRADGLSDLPDASVSAIVTNPPFHLGTAKDSAPTLQMITDAGRVLRPGGELIMVYNSHLPYRQRLQRWGRTEMLVRNRAYLVTRTHRA